MSPTTLEPGTVFNERYRIDGVLGSGGFARVYLATDQQLGRKVALKVLHPTGSSSVAPDPQKVQRFLKRFEREAKIVSRLRAPEIVEVYEFGRTDEGLAFMALEFVDGSNLWQVMHSQGSVAPERVEKILIGVLRGLREAHDIGVHHRDLKPANIMVYNHRGETDLVKLLDFGVVKITRDIGVSFSALTTEGNVVGTPRYMAPEYITDNKVSEQTDLYSVGLVAYELLTGTSVVRGETAMEIMSAHITPESERLPADLEVSNRLRTVVNGLLEKDTAKRFGSADDVLALLERGRLAGHTQDEISLAETLESEALLRAAGAPAPPVDAPAEIPIVDAPTPKPEQLASRHAPKPERPSKPLKPEPAEIEVDWPEDRPASPHASAVGRTGSRRRLLVMAVAVFMGLMLGAAIWWTVRG